MKSRHQVFWAILCVGVLCSAAIASDRGGKWIDTRDTNTFVIFTPTNITISVNTTQEVWNIFSKTNRADGVFASRDGVTNKVVRATKFNETILRIGDRHWVLRKEGTDMSGVRPPC